MALRGRRLLAREHSVLMGVPDAAVCGMVIVFPRFCTSVCCYFLDTLTVHKIQILALYSPVYESGGSIHVPNCRSEAIRWLGLRSNELSWLHCDTRMLQAANQSVSLPMITI